MKEPCKYFKPTYYDDYMGERRMNGNCNLSGHDCNSEGNNQYCHHHKDKVKQQENANGAGI